MPGPQLRGESSFSAAIVCCLISVLLLLLFPLLIARAVLNKSPRELGLGLGDVRYGGLALLICGPAMVVGTLVGSSDPQIQAFYPIPGDSIGNHFGLLVSWFAAYLSFYVSFEFFYRGFMLAGWNSSNETQALVTAIAVQGLFCFLVHIGKPNIELLASLPASLLFGWIAWRSRSIWYGVAIHFAVGVANDLGAM